MKDEERLIDKIIFYFVLAVIFLFLGYGWRMAQETKFKACVEQIILDIETGKEVEAFRLLKCKKTN